MAPRKRNKQDELNRTYRGVDAGRVGSSLRKQGYSQDKDGNTYYTVGGVKYDASTGRPIKAKDQPKPAKRDKPVQSAVQSRQSSGDGGSSRPMPAAVTSGSSSSSSRSTPPASRPASDAGMKNQDKNYRGNLFEKTFGYKKGEAPDQVAKRNKAIEDGRASKAEYNVSEEEGKRRLKGTDYNKQPTNRTETAFNSSSLANTTVPSFKGSANGATNNTAKSFSSNSDSLADLLRKRRQNQ